MEAFAKEKLVFDNEGLATRLYPTGLASKIVVDPHHQFGQPVIEGTNITTAVLYSMYKSGESVEQIGKLYDLKVEWINEAIQFSKQAAA